MPHNLCFLFSTKCLLFHKLSITVQTVLMFFINHVLKFQYQHGCLKVNNNNNNNNNNNGMCAKWKQKAAQVIPIAISSTRVIPKSISQSLTTLSLHPNTYIQLQKSVILGTCSIVGNFLNYK